MKLKKKINKILEYIFTLFLILFLLIWAGIIAFVTNVPTGSMLPTIQLNNKYVVLKDFLVKDYKRGDIVVFHQENDPDTALVKRLIGLPGEIVDIRDGAVFINGDFLEEPYLGSNETSYSKTFYVPEDCYLFLGDNRADSLDARYWEQPYIHKDFLFGKVEYEIYPHFMKVKNPFP